MMPTQQSLFFSPDSVSSPQVLEGLQELALGQVSVDTQTRCPSGGQSQAQGIWYVGQASPGHGRGGDAGTTCPE